MNCPTCSYPHANAFIGCTSCGWKPGEAAAPVIPELHPAALAEIHPMNATAAVVGTAGPLVDHTPPVAEPAAPVSPPLLVPVEAPAPTQPVNPKQTKQPKA